MAGLTVKHVFQSAKGDGVDATLVQPSNWNASHDLEMDTGNLLGRHTAGAGVVEELTPTVVAAMLLTAIQAALSLGALATKNTVGSADIADGSVANVDLANMTAPAFKGRTTAGAGAPEDLTVSQATALLAAFAADTGIAVGVKGLVPASSIGDAAARKVLLATGAFGPDNFSGQLLHIRNEQLVGVGGGAITSGAFRTCNLNTIKTNEISATLVANQIGIPAGVYYVEGVYPALNDGGGTQAKLRNVTDSSDLILGTGAVSNNSFMGNTPSVLSGRFTLAAAKTIELQARVASTTNQGEALSFGTEVYADVRIWKVG